MQIELDFSTAAWLSNVTGSDSNVNMSYTPNDGLVTVEINDDYVDSLYMLMEELIFDFPFNSDDLDSEENENNKAFIVYTAIDEIES